MSILAIPDIHGYRSELDRVLALADAQCGAEARIVFLGDLTDRGPDSRGVIDRLIEGLEAGRDWVVLRGNHDQMFLDFLRGPGPGARWLNGNIGGSETLRSYGAGEAMAAGDWLAAADCVPRAHREFLAGLPFSHETEAQFFVHAGIRPGVPLDVQEIDDLLWIRQEFHGDTRDHGKLIVHGHTPVERPAHYGNRINLDAGAGFGRPLNVAEIEGREAWLLTAEGRVPLTP
jgi:serine/threonine protein phosphatase 1